MTGKSLSQQLDLPAGSRLAVVGCGGKTSAINCIAKGSTRNCKILIAPTTAIFMPEDESLCFNSEKILEHIPKQGIQYAGIKKGSKLKALPLGVLERSCKGYDLTLMEADGSRGLPLKGWAEYEPVVPECTTHFIGIVLINCLGQIVSENNVHRLSLFTELTGLKIGDKVTNDALCKMIFSGMLKKSRGEVTLLLNGVNSQNDERAINFINFIQPKLKNIQVLMGNTYTDIWYKIH